MGIDKPNVRFVIHSTLSKSMETYLQESGRAGRDGNLSRCTLFYRGEDIAKVSSLIHDSNNKDVAQRNLYNFICKYCEYDGKTCRRISMARVLEEEEPENIKCNNLCDICCSKDLDSVEYDATNAAIQVIKLLQLIKMNNVRENISMIQLLDSWLGNGKIIKELKQFVDDTALVKLKAPKKEVANNKSNLMKIIVRMLTEGYLEEIFIANLYNWNVYVDVSNKGNMFLGRQQSLSNSRFDSNSSSSSRGNNNSNNALMIVLDPNNKRKESFPSSKKKRKKDGGSSSKNNSSGSSTVSSANSKKKGTKERKKRRKEKHIVKNNDGNDVQVINLIDDDDATNAVSSSDDFEV